MKKIFIDGKAGTTGLRIYERLSERADIEIILLSDEERKNPDILRASRKERIAKGSGTTVVDVNRLLKQFDQMKVQMKQMSAMMKSGRFPRFK